MQHANSLNVMKHLKIIVIDISIHVSVRLLCDIGIGGDLSLVHFNDTAANFVLKGSKHEFY